MAKENLILMIDLETYGTDEFAIIREIAITPFMVGNGYHTFRSSSIDLYPKIEVQKQMGRTSDPSTLGWWKSHIDTDNQISYCTEHYGVHPKEAAEKIVKFVEGLKKKYTVYFMGRGITTFDYPILKHFCAQFGFNLNIAFYRLIDLRSVTSLVKLCTGIDIPAQTETSHKALDDVYDQISQVFRFATLLGQDTAKNPLEFIDGMGDIFQTKVEVFED